MNYLRNLTTVQKWFADSTIVQDWFSAQQKIDHRWRNLIMCSLHLEVAVRPCDVRHL